MAVILQLTLVHFLQNQYPIIYRKHKRNQERRELNETGAPFLLDFLLDVVKKVVIKEFSEGNSQPIAELLQRNHAGILTLGVEHAVNGGGSYPGTAGKGIDGDASFVAQSQNPSCDSFFRDISCGIYRNSAAYVVEYAIYRKMGGRKIWI